MLAQIDQQIRQKRDMLDQMQKGESAQEYVDDLLNKSATKLSEKPNSAGAGASGYNFNIA